MEQIPFENVIIPAEPAPSIRDESTQENRESSEHYEEYDHTNYVRELSRFVLVRRKMLLPDYSLSTARKRILAFKVKEAIASRKIFTIQGYYPAIRHKLVNLGWVEKFDKRTTTDFNLSPLFSLTSQASAPYFVPNETPERVNASYYEERFMSDQMSDEVRPDLLYAMSRNTVEWATLHPDTIVSYFPRCNFCSKIGLNHCLDYSPYYRHLRGNLNYPRGHNISNEACLQRFVQDYQQSSCLSLLRYVKYSYERRRTLMSPGGKVPWTQVNKAEAVCRDWMRSFQLELVEESAGSFVKAVELMEDADEWEQFDKDVYSVTNETACFMYITESELQRIYIQVCNMVEAMEQFRGRHALFDGMFNMWVLKPVADCSGRGIRIFRQLEDIKKALGSVKNSEQTKYVVQKYIERPLLIHGVKFDFRLWFLITKMPSLKIWVYQEGYVRFCSKPYSNIRLDEARHLTNVRVQKNNRASREPQELPPELMWTFAQLDDYFTKALNRPQQWATIMDAIEESLITTMHSAQIVDMIDLRNNTFQLFGADYLIHENFEPCLIEINNGPGLAPTASIIAKKTTQLLTDIVKVVKAEKEVTRNQRSLNIGHFKLIFNGECDERQLRTSGDVQVTPLDVNKWKNIYKTHKTETKVKPPKQRPRPIGVRGAKQTGRYQR